MLSRFIMAKYIIIFAIIYFLVAFYLGFTEAGKIFQSLGIGFGALFGGLGGLTAFWDWRQKKQKEVNYMDNLKRQYPRGNLGTKFKLIQPKRNLGWLFLLDLRDGVKHWIKDTKTLRSLDLSYPDSITIDDEEFDSYTEGEAIG